MRRYRERLRSLDLRSHLATPAPRIAAWLTGQSSYRHSQLSPEQQAVLDDLENAGYSVVRGGFPFNAATLTLPYRAEPLLPASLRNGAQFLAAVADRTFGAELARHLQPLADAAGERLLLVCGSCGLRLLAAAMPHLTLAPALRLGAVALGPVGGQPRAHAQLEATVIRGTRDWISRLGSRQPADVSPAVDHLGYAADSSTRDAIRQAALSLAR